MHKLYVGLVVLLCFSLSAPAVLADAYDAPWRHKNSSIVLDAYEYTLLDWTKLKNNSRLAGFINKASDGLPPTPTCRRDAYCRLKWRRYVAAKELYHTRKTLAKTLGLKWGAYHLARPGNPVQQADHFLRFTQPKDDELLALDIEHNDPSRWMSLEDAEIFARIVKRRTGRYPVLYTNHATAKFIAENRNQYKLLAKLNLWYARYKGDIRGVFPMGNWSSYTLWQFSSMANCNKRRCLRRIAGADNFIDVNVVAMAPAKLKKSWPFAKLTAQTDLPGVNSAPVLAQGPTGQAQGFVQTLVSAFFPRRPELPVVNALNTVIGDDAQGTDVMAVTGRVAVPRWKPEARVLLKTVLVSAEEIGVPNLLVSLAQGPRRPDKGNAFSQIKVGELVQPEHALDAFAEPRETMVRAEKPIPKDGILKLFPAEAVMTQRLLKRNENAVQDSNIF